LAESGQKTLKVSNHSMALATGSREGPKPFGF